MSPRPNRPPKIFLTRVPSPIGLLHLAVRDGALVALEFGDRIDGMRARLEARAAAGAADARGKDPAGRAAGHGAENAAGISEVPPDDRSVASVTRAVGRYFAGDLAALDRVKILADGTPFQQSVWTELRKIPAGTTISYAELAHRIGRPQAVRAAGAANGANPIGIVIPCHRVIGANGNLTGYGGGIEKKSWLLEHERKHAPETPSPDYS